MMDKPFSAACERNKAPILEVLQAHFSDRRRVLEIGSGTGQHAVHFAQAMPQVEWLCSDREHNLPGIQIWLDEARLGNTPAAQALDVNAADWRIAPVDAAFSANTLHIMAWPEVVRMFQGLDRVLRRDARLVIYGPFKRAGAHTSESNARFDEGLRAEAAHMGVRDLEAVLALASSIGLRLDADLAMPANNACLVWSRS